MNNKHLTHTYVLLYDDGYGYLHPKKAIPKQENILMYKAPENGADILDKFPEHIKEMYFTMVGMPLTTECMIDGYRVVRDYYGPQKKSRQRVCIYRLTPEDIRVLLPLFPIEDY